MNYFELGVVSISIISILYLFPYWLVTLSPMDFTYSFSIWPTFLGGSDFLFFLHTNMVFSCFFGPILSLIGTWDFFTSCVSLIIFSASLWFSKCCVSLCCSRAANDCLSAKCVSVSFFWHWRSIVALTDLWSSLLLPSFQQDQAFSLDHSDWGELQGWHQWSCIQVFLCTSHQSD